MHFSIIEFLVIAVASAFGAVLAMFRRAFNTGEDPSDDGRRALISEFFGLWIGFIFLICSFTVEGKTLQWTMRGAAIIFGLVGLSLSVYFASTAEIHKTADKEPTGFKNKTTDLHLD